MVSPFVLDTIWILTVIQHCLGTLLCGHTMLSGGQRLQAMDWEQFKGAYEGLTQYYNIYLNFLLLISDRCIYQQSKAMYRRRWCAQYMLFLNSATLLDAMSMTPIASVT